MHPPTHLAPLVNNNIVQVLSDIQIILFIHLLTKFMCSKTNLAWIQRWMDSGHKETNKEPNLTWIEKWINIQTIVKDENSLYYDMDEHLKQAMRQT